MKRIQQLTVLCLVLILAALAAPSAMAATQPDPPKAPIPAQILAAHSIFIANGGDKVNMFGNPTLAYDVFYAAMKNSGRYQLASSPANADLVYEISVDGAFGVPTGVVTLTILDPRTNVVLWRTMRSVAMAALQSNRRKNFDATMQTLVTDPIALPNPAPAAQ